MIYLKDVVELVAIIAGAIGGFYVFIYRLGRVERDIAEININLNNHITDLRKKMDNIVERISRMEGKMNGR